MNCHKCGFQVYADGSCNCTRQFQGQMFGQSQSFMANNLYMDSFIKGIDQIGGLLMEIRDLLKTGSKPEGK